MDKERYHEILLPEIVRYAKIRSMDPEHLDEYGAAVFAAWFTQNPLGIDGRSSICNFDEPQEPVVFDKKSALEAFGNPKLGGEPLSPKIKRAKNRKGVRFTVHTHPDEPLEASPDDLLAYDCFDSLRSHSAELSAHTGSAGDDDILHFIVDGYTCRKAEPDKNKTNPQL